MQDRDASERESLAFTSGSDVPRMLTGISETSIGTYALLPEKVSQSGACMMPESVAMPTCGIYSWNVGIVSSRASCSLPGASPGS